MEELINKEFSNYKLKSLKVLKNVVALGEYSLFFFGSYKLGKLGASLVLDSSSELINTWGKRLGGGLTSIFCSVLYTETFHNLDYYRPSSYLQRKIDKMEDK